MASWATQPSASGAASRLRGRRPSTERAGNLAKHPALRNGSAKADAAFLRLGDHVGLHRRSPEAGAGHGSAAHRVGMAWPRPGPALWPHPGTSSSSPLLRTCCQLLSTKPVPPRQPHPSRAPVWKSRSEGALPTGRRKGPASTATPGARQGTCAARGGRTPTPSESWIPHWPEPQLPPPPQRTQTWSTACVPLP